MFRKRKLIDNDKEEIQELLRERAQQPLTRDVITSELIHRLCVTIVSLESCIEKINDSNNLHPLRYSEINCFDLFDLLELGLNVSAINNDIQNYIVEPLERGL